MRRWATNTDQPVIVLSSNELTQDFNAKAYWAGTAISSERGFDDILPNPAAYHIGVITKHQKHALLVVDGEVGDPMRGQCGSGSCQSVEQLKQRQYVGIYQTGPHFAVLHVERPSFEL